MAKAVIRDSHMNFGGIKYFRGKAEDVEPGSYGDKREPAFGMNYLDVYKDMPLGKVKVDEPTIAAIDFSQTHKSDISVGADFAVIGASAGNTYSRLKKGALKLVKFGIDRGDMVDLINQRPNHRGKMVDLGNDVRVCHEVWVVMEAKLADTIARASSLDAEYKGANLSVSVSGGRHTEVTLSEGTTFAYLLLKLDWDHKRRKKRDKVTGAKVDQWGPS